MCIELQVVFGVVLVVIGFWYDDYIVGDFNLVMDDLLGVLIYIIGVEVNDKFFCLEFFYFVMFFVGDGECSGMIVGLISLGLQAFVLNFIINMIGQV